MPLPSLYDYDYDYDYDYGLRTTDYGPLARSPWAA